MSSDVSQKSVQHQPSQTAMATATMRALSAHDDREEVRGADTLAELFLDDERKGALRDAASRRWVIANRSAPGMYEFMIARTAFFDQAVRDALEQSLPQVVFLGAGYDTRPYRFRDLIQDTRLFELDAPPTQAHKREVLAAAGVPIPPQLAYVPIDFTKDNLKDALIGAGFAVDRRALFVWEGVSYYLTSGAVDDVLASIRAISAPGSSLCFDYGSLSVETLSDGRVKQLRGIMKSDHSGEPTRFGIPAGTLGEFMAARGYEVVEEVGPAEMEARYLTLRDGSSVGKVPALFALVRARAT